ncbi:hypothetical protein K501DRAFT_285018 [Backusella circina FSU 941]|nr:hypothetical protein K501DRAFT_285018 [Backusella circina FSU 941]
MAASNANATADNGFLLLDDEEDFKMVSNMDASHNFLNFSRRITESSSMKRPVDIQLGIACGKDLVFSRSPLQGSAIPKASVSSGPVKLPNEAKISASSPVISGQPNTKKNRLSLDRLVKDVLVHIESCPGQSPYSDDLDRLKPKLVAYNPSP